MLLSTAFDPRDRTVRPVRDPHLFRADGDCHGRVADHDAPHRTAVRRVDPDHRVAGLVGQPDPAPPRGDRRRGEGKPDTCNDTARTGIDTPEGAPADRPDRSLARRNQSWRARQRHRFTDCGVRRSEEIEPAPARVGDPHVSSERHRRCRRAPVWKLDDVADLPELSVDDRQLLGRTRDDGRELTDVGHVGWPSRHANPVLRQRAWIDLRDDAAPSRHPHAPRTHGHRRRLRPDRNARRGPPAVGIDSDE
jgi:hypothetical protein